MNPTFHRGAVVSVRTPLIFKGVEIHFDAFHVQQCRWQWDLIRDKSKEISATRYNFLGAKPSRQNRKGPITRYGVKR